MAPEALWRDVQGQALYALLAVAGATLLPGGSLSQRLGLGRGRLGTARLGAALIGFLALSHALHDAVVALGLLEGTTLAEIDKVVREASPLRPLLVWLAVGLAPALGEELLFRGFLLRLLALRWPGAVAVVGSAVLFGAAHLDWVQGASAFLLGAYLAALTQRAGSLRPALLCHATNNSLAVAGSAGLLPALVPDGAGWPLAAALALGAGCIPLWWRGASLQPCAPPADGMASPRGPHEDDAPGPDRRRR
jgi:membrane protease YdiL (CAAX protease family)